jgi:hypothetical protein
VQERTFEQFMQAVRESCEKHAQRKGYTDGGIDGPNQLLGVCSALGIHHQHSIGEIIYKAAEFLRTPRPVLLEKISGWAWMIWRTMPAEEESNSTKV